MSTHKQALELVTRENIWITFEGQTTVRNLKKLLKAVGYNIEGKKCYITKNGITKEALDAYVIETTDGITFDTKNPKRPVIVSVQGDNCDITCKDNNVTISYR